MELTGQYLIDNGFECVFDEFRKYYHEDNYLVIHRNSDGMFFTIIGNYTRDTFIKIETTEQLDMIVKMTFYSHDTQELYYG